MKKLFTLETNLYDPGDMHSDYSEYNSINNIANVITDKLIVFISKYIIQAQRKKKEGLNYPFFVDNNALSTGKLRIESLFIPKNDEFEFHDVIDEFFIVLQTAIEVLFLECEQYFENYIFDPFQKEPCEIHNDEITGGLSISVKHRHTLELAHRLHTPLKDLYKYNPTITFKLTAGSNSINIPGVVVLNEYLTERRDILEKVHFESLLAGDQTKDPHAYFIELKNTSKKLRLTDIPHEYLDLAARIAKPKHKDPGTVIGWRVIKKLRLDETETSQFIVKSLHRTSDIGQSDMLNDYSKK